LHSIELYAIVNNAGIQAEFLYDDFLELNDYKEAINVNTYGAIRVTKAFKNLVKKSRGRIVFCTSCICRFPAPGMGAYSTSKWALTGYLEVIRHELRDYGVDVISVEPGIYCTPLNAIERTMKAMNATWARASNELREEYGEYWFSRGKRFFINVHDASPTDVTPVIDAYFHAITAKYPYKNYVVGLDAILLGVQLALLSNYRFFYSNHVVIEFSDIFEGCQRLLTRSSGLAGQLDCFIMDVRSEESVTTALNHLKRTTTVIHKGLYGLVNNAGVSGVPLPDDLLTLDDYRRVVDVNAFGVIRVTHAFKELIKEQRRELSVFGVNVCAIEPGFFSTPMVNMDNIEEKLHIVWENISDGLKQQYGKKYLNY
uniref:Uncharacterized protein n=1 Tax=Ascaris lumbricoides TaxID=6252 RepID=A0A9J2Q345_ASCLU